MATKRPDPPKPAAKEDYIKIEKREPTEAELLLLLEAGAKLGIRPGYGGVMARHESNGTWHPEIRPSRLNEPPVRITTTGEVRGVPASSGTGIGQWINPTWLFDMYHNGESIIETAELAKHNPAAVEVIRKANQKMKAELDRTKQKPDWNAFNALENKFVKDPEIAALYKLRSDKTNRIPIFDLMHGIRSHDRELKAAGIDPNGTNIYILHHTNLGQLNTLLRNKDYVAADDPKMAKAAAINGNVFMNADGTGKTGAESLAYYATIMSDAHASVFERRYYGRDFGPAPDDSRMRSVAGADGKSYKVMQKLLTTRLPVQDFIAAWKQPSPSAETPENLGGTASALRKLGYYAGKAEPQDFSDRNLKSAISAFKHQAGLPHADEGKLDVATQRILQQSVANADRYIALQQQQAQLVDSKTGLNLRTLEKDQRLLAPNDPARKETSAKVVELKDMLAKQGLLKPPVKLERVPAENGKTRRIEVAQPFTDKVDNALLKAYENFQTQNGLLNTKGFYENVTAGVLRRASNVPAPPTNLKVSQADGSPPTQHFNTIGATPLAEQMVSMAALAAALQEPAPATPLKPAEPVIEAAVIHPSRRPEV